MRIVIGIAFLLAAAAGPTAYDHSALAETGPCHVMEFERAAYTICEVDLHKHTVRLYWNRSNGTPYAYLSALPRSLEGGTGRMLFATNAGMFDSNLKPVGLYVEQARELVHADTKPAGQLGLPGSRERCSLFVADADPLNLAAADRVGERIERIADEAEDMLNSDPFEHADQRGCYRVGHLRLLGCCDGCDLPGARASRIAPFKYPAPQYNSGQTHDRHRSWRLQCGQYVEGGDPIVAPIVLKLLQMLPG